MNRLETIKSMVSKCKVAADIGTDHGYVAEMLLNDNICEKIIATDINKGPLNRAIEHLTSVKLNDKVDFRLGSGLKVLKENEADSIVIAGMGGELIADIIDTSINIAQKAQELILQPMTTADRLRRYLYENSFIIIDEKIVKELHHYYFIIKAAWSKDKKVQINEAEDEIYFETGKILINKKDPVMMEYLQRQININDNIIQNLEKNNNEEYNEKVNQLKAKNKKFRELM